MVCVPNNRLEEDDLGFLYVDGGSTKSFDQPPTSVEQILDQVCRKSRVISAGLYQIPNEPIIFPKNPTRGRSEDSMIAFTWSHFVNNTFETDWIAQFPMTKAAVKAMDAVEDFVNNYLPALQPQAVTTPISRFVISGGSKRGWVTWLVGAIGDPRVTAIAPLVAPIPRLQEQMLEMWQSYGNWTFALKDYVNMNLMGFLELPEFDQLMYYLDPLTYPEEMSRIPKYVVASCGDEFFMPDSARFYWDQLPGPKLLRLAPDAEHSLYGSRTSIIESTIEFVRAVTFPNITLPSYTWEFSPNGSTITINATTDYLVTDAAKVWFSKDNSRRDWRLLRCVDDSVECLNFQALFGFEKLPMTAPGIFTYTIADPKVDHWSAFLIEIQYDFGGPSTMKVTSNLSIVPQTFPYPPCPQDVCACAYDCSHNYYQ